MGEFKLNPQQKRAVFHKDGPCVVVAVPGAGKTAVTVKRYQRLMANGVDSDRILCTTFTRKAAQEMKDRVNLKMGQVAYIGTLHSILWRIVLKHQDQLFNLDEGEGLELLERNFQKNKILIKIMRDFSGVSERDVTDTQIASIVDFGNILTTIGQLKNFDVSPHECHDGMRLGPFEFAAPKFSQPYNIEFRDLYAEYEDQKTANRQIDFDDMLVLSLRLLRESPSIREDVKSRWDYIMVDEFQDINPIQWSILQILAEDHRNIFCVGDANQSLYGFRGANPDFIYKFKQYYPDCAEIRMVNNYRCSEPVIEATNNLAKTSVYKAGDIIGTGKAGSFEYRRFLVQAEAAAFVAEYIKQHLQDPNVSPRDFAVIYRTNAMSRPYEDALFSAGIDYVVRGGDPFYLTREVQDVLNYMSLALYPGRSTMHRVKQILSRPSRYLGEQFLNALGDRIAAGANLHQALNSPYPERRGWEPGARLLSVQLKGLARLENNVADAVRFISKDIEYEGFVKKSKDTPEVAVAYLEELEDMGSKFRSVPDFLTVMAERIKAAKAKKQEHNPDAVNLTTIHSAKGLEFKYVLVVNFNDGALPHKKSTAIDEEKRGLYVAITRAIDECTLVSHEINSMEQEGARGNDESPFLRDLGLVPLDTQEDERCQIMVLPRS